MRQSKYAYQIRIELNHTNPSVYRVLSIPGILTLEHLHEIIQVVFGWKDYHIHYFIDGKTKKRYEPSEENKENVLDTEQYTLNDVFTTGDTWLYHYDDNEEWVHTITVEDRFLQDATAYSVHLLDWEQDNVTEEAGSIQSYDERKKILLDQDHEDHAAMVKWFQLSHIEFDEDTVEEQLSSIMANDMYDTYEDNYEQIGSLLEEYFQFVDEETVVDLTCDAGSCFVQFVKMNDLKSVHFFQSESEYAHAYYERGKDYQIHPLYQNGAEIVYSTPKLREELELMIDFPMDVMIFYHESLGNSLIDEGNGWGNLLSLCKALKLALNVIKQNQILVPDMRDHKILQVEVQSKEIKCQRQHYEPKLETLCIPYIYDTIKELQDVRHTDEHLMMEILPIPAIYGEERKYQFYLAAMGEKTSMLHRLQEIDYPNVLEECMRYLVDGMKLYGAPEEITLTDYHFYWHFHEQLETYGVQLHFQKELEYDFNDMYADAFMEANPLSEDKKRRMMMLLDMSDEEVSDYMDQLSDEETQDFLKDMALFHFIK